MKKITAFDTFEFNFRSWKPALERREDFEKAATVEFELQLKAWLEQFDFKVKEKP